MGNNYINKVFNCCNIHENFNFFPENEKEIVFPKYNSNNDKFLEIIDKTYNLFTLLPLVDYVNLLEHYSIENATIPFEEAMKTKYSSKEEFFSVPIFIEEFQSFIENKICEHKNIIELKRHIENNEKIEIFKDYCKESYRSLDMKLKKNDSNKKNIIKINLLPFGILYCLSSNIGKMRLIFDLFKDDKEEFIKSKKLDEYLLSNFLLASYCTISSRRKIGINHQNVSEIIHCDLLKYLDSSELKDCQNLVKFFDDNFFLNKSSFTWEEFKTMFKGEDSNINFAWIFSPQGIRKKLEENNI